MSNIIEFPRGGNGSSQASNRDDPCDEMLPGYEQHHSPQSPQLIRVHIQTPEPSTTQKFLGFIVSMITGSLVVLMIIFLITQILKG